MSSLWFFSDLHELCKQGTWCLAHCLCNFGLRKHPGGQRDSTVTKCTFFRNIQLACARAGQVLMIWLCYNDRFVKECVHCFNSPLPTCWVDGGCVAKYSPIHLTRKQRQMIKKHQYSEAAIKLTLPRSEEQQAQPKSAAVVSCYNCRCTGSTFSQTFLRHQPEPDNNSSLHGTAWCLWQSHVHLEWQKMVRKKTCI